ncbi:PREDICTED: cyclic nucleotide-binding domain-containing protein 2 [Gekko japonicus]|uniref:Cyclic nucleotide-binding domain-containing protein 2 n=1 Tax=Gekko japonicus TaxID=146911 RepID=A0ABM1JNF8_GEKJA|nr:PREDICTED: cyclic nucleotide-binding domain-containing protein 2 [Gekko japonicus]
MHKVFLCEAEAFIVKAADNCKTWGKTMQKLMWQLILRMRVCRFFRDGLKGFSGFHLIEQELTADIEEDHFPFKAIQITKKPPEWRTEAEIRYLRNRLLALKSFLDYSPTLQYLLAKVVRFERFGRRRVIIKKGHLGGSFYFIFAGMVAVTDDEDGSSAFVEASPTVLRRGSCFGEVALIKDATRIATVVCMEDTELLVVDKKDFFGYQLDQELHREFLTRYNYLRKVDIFETLSNASVEKIAHFCRIERFHFGQVITSDIGESSSISFIIKGACDVLRQVDLSNCPSYHKWLVNLQDNRPMILVSKGADFIRLKKDKLEECADDATIMKLCKIKVKYPSDDELCQVFLRQNSWDFFKKDLLQFVLKPKLMRMVLPPDACPAKEIAGSWYMNEKGILDLTPLQRHEKLPPETCKYVACHPKCASDARFLPEIQPRLIHGINIIRPSLDGVF